MAQVFGSSRETTVTVLVDLLVNFTANDNESFGRTDLLEDCAANVKSEQF